MAKRAKGRKSGGDTMTAAPTLRQAIEAYSAALPAKRRREASFGLELLEGFLNSYAYESLSPAETRRFDRLFNKSGAGHREYCEIFGPEKLVPALGHFFGWFLIRKVMAGPADLGRIARETGRLVEWLGERGDLPAPVVQAGVELAGEAASVLPRAGKAAALLNPGLGAAPVTTGDVIEGYFRVARLAPGKVWLESWDDGKTYGPLAVPAAASSALRVEWELSGAVGRVGRKWELLEAWNVYPELG